MGEICAVEVDQLFSQPPIQLLSQPPSLPPIQPCSQLRQLPNPPHSLPPGQLPSQPLLRPPPSQPLSQPHQCHLLLRPLVMDRVSSQTTQQSMNMVRFSTCLFSSMRLRGLASFQQTTGYPGEETLLSMMKLLEVLSHSQKYLKNWSHHSRLLWRWRSGQVWISHGCDNHCTCLGWSQLQGIKTHKFWKMKVLLIPGRLWFSRLNPEAHGGSKVGHWLLHWVSSVRLWVHWPDRRWWWWPRPVGVSWEQQGPETSLQDHQGCPRLWPGRGDCCSPGCQRHLVQNGGGGGICWHVLGACQGSVQICWWIQR